MSLDRERVLVTSQTATGRRYIFLGQRLNPISLFAGLPSASQLSLPRPAYGERAYTDWQAAVPETVLINPQIEVLGTQEMGMWEGCLSVPGMRGFVERPAMIRYCGFDQFGNAIDRSVDGFHAVVVQHECDHLDGILYPARIQDFSRFGFEQELENRPDYPN